MSVPLNLEYIISYFGIKVLPLGYRGQMVIGTWEPVRQPHLGKTVLTYAGIRGET